MKKLLYFLCLALVVRMALSFLPAFEYDQSAFRFWSYRLAEVGPAQFYSKEVFTNNPLGMLYFFWLIGIIKSTLLPLDQLLKFPAILADLLTGIIIYKLVKEQLGNKWGNIAASFYIFNPVLIVNSAIWGQYDSVAILFLVLSTYFALIKKSPIICSAFFSLALITKPQSLQSVPFLIYYFIKNFKPILWLYSFLSFAVTAVILFIPFFPHNPIYGIYSVLTGSTNLFNCTTCNALNFWGIFGTWKNDMNLFFSIPLEYWGIGLFLGLLLVIFSRKIKNNSLYFTISISMLSFFMLLTRMHERYSIYFLPFLVISLSLLKSRILVIFYIFFSLMILINLYIPYAYYNNLVKITNLPGVNELFTLFNYLSFINFFGFVLYFLYYLKYVKQADVS